jgi:hypothetical protein
VHRLRLRDGLEVGVRSVLPGHFNLLENQRLKSTESDRWVFLESDMEFTEISIALKKTTQSSISEESGP